MEKWKKWERTKKDEEDHKIKRFKFTGLVP